MKYILLFILISFTCASQTDWQKWSTKNNEAVHFYTAFGINEATYQIQSYAFPKWKPGRKMLVSNLVVLAAVFGKEVYDTRKAHPTGFSKDDIGMGVWSVPVWDIWNICRNNYRGYDVGHRIQEGYYDFTHNYRDKFDSLANKNK